MHLLVADAENETLKLLRTPWVDLELSSDGGCEAGSPWHILHSGNLSLSVCPLQFTCCHVVPTDRGGGGQDRMRNMFLSSL